MERPEAEDRPAKKQKLEDPVVDSKDPYTWYRNIGSPKYITAPMVDQSELAFRLLTRKYGADCAYTPMFHAKNFMEQEVYRNMNFQTTPEDRPLIVQFCGNEPETLLAAAKYVEDRCDAVDINLGCPQGIARKGHYGAFLLTEFDLLKRIVSTLHKGLKVPVTCKIRLLDDIDETIKLALMLQDAGCALLTVHGRTKEEKKDKIGNVNYDAIKRIKDALKIPVIANGGVSSKEDADAIMKYTGVDGVMSSEAILENPTLYAPDAKDPETNLPLNNYQIVDEYFALARKHTDLVSCGKKGQPHVLKMVRGHLFKLLHHGFQTNHEVRTQLGNVTMKDGTCWDNVADIVKRQKEHAVSTNNVLLIKDWSHDSNSWYQRYIKKIPREALKTIKMLSDKI